MCGASTSDMKQRRLHVLQQPTGKKTRFFKVFKVAGKTCITTVSKKSSKKKVTTRPWWTSNANSSTIRWWIRAYEWTKWPLGSMLETHPSGILSYWKIKKLQQYDVIFIFCSTAIFLVCSSFNIQYQSTGIGSMPSLSEIELKRSVRGLFLSTYGTFRWTCL